MASILRIDNRQQTMSKRAHSSKPNASVSPVVYSQNSPGGYRPFAPWDSLESPVNYPGWDTGRSTSPSFAPIGGYQGSLLNHLPSPSPGREMRSPSEQPQRHYSKTSPSFTPIGSYVYPRSPLNRSDEDEPSPEPQLRYSKTSPSFAPIGGYPRAPLNRSPSLSPSPRYVSTSPSYMPTEPNEEAQDYEDHRRQEKAKRPKKEPDHARIQADYAKLVPKVIEAELDLEIPEPYAGGWRQLGLDIQKQIELDEAKIEELAERLRKRKNAKEAVVAFDRLMALALAH